MVSTFSRVLYGLTGYGHQSCSWSAKQGKKMFFPLSPFAPVNLVSQDGYSCPVPSRVSLLILQTQAESDDLTGFLPIPAAASILR